MLKFVWKKNFSFNCILYFGSTFTSAVLCKNAIIIIIIIIIVIIIIIMIKVRIRISIILFYF